MPAKLVLGIVHPSVRRTGANSKTPGPGEIDQENESPQGNTRRAPAPFAQPTAPGAPGAGPSAPEPQRLDELREIGASASAAELNALGAGINLRGDPEAKAETLMRLMASVDEGPAAAACVGLLSSPRLEEHIAGLAPPPAPMPPGVAAAAAAERRAAQQKPPPPPPPVRTPGDVDDADDDGYDHDYGYGFDEGWHGMGGNDEAPPSSCPVYNGFEYDF